MGADRLAWWSRREALGLGLIASTSLVGLGSALYGRGHDQPGGQSYVLGTLKQVARRMPASGVLTFPEIKAHLVRYDATASTPLVYPESPPGLLLLSWRSSHLGCKVPFCESSQWFEDPCHGSRFNKVGEYKFGPAVRSLSRFPLRVVEGVGLVADTRNLSPGPPRGTDTIGQIPAGPHCVG
jgi:cytochrome b6-f complex iron-sulfur subunit